jgi:hypothetical protein
MSRDRILAAIASKSEREPMSGCWLWSASVFPAGYGQLGLRGVERAAHRASFIAHKGPIPTGAVICHTCDTRCCVNPAHLFAGTHADNMRDAAAKGRAAKGMRNGSAKLDGQQRAAIRALSGRVSQSELARRFGVSQQLVSRICRVVDCS